MFYKFPQVKTVSRYADFSSHLGSRSFMAMFGLAAFIHLCVIGIVAMMPHNPVIKIPVRVLNFNLGAGSAQPAPQAEQPTAAEIIAAEATKVEFQEEAPASNNEANTEEKKSDNEEVAQSEFEKALTSQKVEPVKPTKSATIVSPTPKKPVKESTVPAKPKAVTESVEVAKGVALNMPTSPKKYVRASPLEITQPTSPNAVSGAEEIVQRYEQAISVWISRHKAYPEEAKRRRVEGSPTVRVRINRKGKVLYHVIEKSSGDAFIDQALMNMVKAADPMPAVPENYPQGEELEFLVPVSFSLKDQR